MYKKNYGTNYLNNIYVELRTITLQTITYDYWNNLISVELRTITSLQTITYDDDRITIGIIINSTSI